MPFTPAHVAAVVPLRRFGLPMSALAAGAMSPDVPLFVAGDKEYGFTHSLWGVVTADVLIALLLVGVWFLLIRDAYADVTPWIRDRVAARAHLTRRQWALAPVAAVVGALTHVIWDSATHPGRWIVQHIRWLEEDHAGMLGLKWAQYLSGVLGMVFVAGYVVWLLAKRPVARRPRSAVPANGCEYPRAECCPE